MNEPTTHFAPGRAAAYVSAGVMVLAEHAVPDGVSGSLASLVRDHAPIADLVAATETIDDVALVSIRGDAISAVARGAMVIDVVGDHASRIDGSAEPDVHEVGGVRVVRLRAGHEVGVDDAVDEIGFVVVAGVVPAASLARTLAATVDRAASCGQIRPATAPPDDLFDAMFGSTVVRSVEAAAVRDGTASGASRQPLGVLLFSTGERVVVDKPLLLGRNPHPDHPVHGEEPRLVKLLGAGVSRRHAAITVDRWRAHIDDLGSANGTDVTLPGRPPQRLAPGSPVGLVAGARVDLGGDVSFVVEEVA